MHSVVFVHGSGQNSRLLASLLRQEEMPVRGLGRLRRLEGKKEANERVMLRRRVAQARHRASIAALFQTLKTVVCPAPADAQVKWKILDHTKGFLLERETYLSKLLLLKRVFLKDDEGPNNLEDVRECYRSLYSECLTPRTPQTPDLVVGPGSSEADSTDEGVYKSYQSSALSFSNTQDRKWPTPELRLDGRTISSDQVGLPVVSEPISGLWNSISPEQRAAAQQLTQDESSASWEGQADNRHSSSLNSQLTSLDASGSSGFEEDLLQDGSSTAPRDMDSTSGKSSGLQSERLDSIYRDAVGLVKSYATDEQEVTQGLFLTADSDELFLRCSESFDEDF